MRDGPPKPLPLRETQRGCPVPFVVTLIVVFFYIWFWFVNLLTRRQ